MGRPVDKGSVAYIEEVKVEEVPVSEPDTKSAKSEAEKVIRAIVQDKHFPARPTAEKCRECDFKTICRDSGS